MPHHALPIAELLARHAAAENAALHGRMVNGDHSGTSAMSAWNPTQYEKFRLERSRPFDDLRAMIAVAPGGRLVDLGCGTGELTRRLHESLGAHETLGIDTSETMLAKAAAHSGPGIFFRIGNLGELEPDSAWDLVFSHAAIHWVDDHPALLARLLGAVRPGGQLAVQMPANHDHPSHVVAAEVAQEEPFRTALGGHVRRSPVLAPEQYAALLHGLGARDVRVSLNVYLHELESRDGVVEWVRGTLLTAYEERLPAELFGQFVARYRERLRPHLADTTTYLYPFKRILFVATRPV